MEVIKKKFNAPSSFPVSFVYQDTKDLRSELPSHFHEWYEIIYINHGAGTFYIDNKFYLMSPGDLYLIPRDIIHHTIPNRDHPTNASVIFFEEKIIHNEQCENHFSYLNMFEKAAKLKEYHVALHPYQRKAIESILNQIAYEFIEKPIGYKSSIIQWLHLMLLSLNRIILEKGPTPIQPLETGPKWMKEILAHIEENLDHPLTLHRLAKKAFVTPEHLTRVFKNMTGMTLINYINSKRVIKAKELLLKTNKNVTAIAEEVGFKSAPYFYRTFKKYVGLTPSEYRVVIVD